jgi:hypothetical protein
MTDDHLCSLIERLAGVRRDLVERLMAAAERTLDRRIPDGLHLLADVHGAIAADEGAVQACGSSAVGGFCLQTDHRARRSH